MSGARTEDTIRPGLINLENDGGPEPEPEIFSAWWRHAFEEVLAPLRFDWLGLTELTYSQTRPDAPARDKAAAERRWQAAQEVLGMRGFRAAMGQGRNPTGPLVREPALTLAPAPSGI
jgi:hypothetical protein